MKEIEKNVHLHPNPPLAQEQIKYLPLYNLNGIYYTELSLAYGCVYKT